MIFILPIWYWGFIQGIMVGIMLSNMSYHHRDKNSEDKQLMRLIKKNKHRIINL